MCTCLEIRIYGNSVNFLAEHERDDINNVYALLDLLPDTEIITKNSLSKLSEVNTLNIEEISSIQVPNTSKNLRLLESIINPSSLNSYNNSVRCTTITGNSTLSNNLLSFISHNISENTLELRLLPDTENWIVKASVLKLNNILSLDTILDFTSDTVISYNSLGPYTDGSIGVRFPLCYYGRFSNPYNVMLHDFRPWFSVLWLLQQGFCQIGYKFRSPILETDYGRRLIAYLLDKEYCKKVGLLTDLEFRATRTSIFFTPPMDDMAVLDVVFDTEDYDNGNNFNLVDCTYTGACVSDVYVRTVMDVKPAPNTGLLSIFDSNISTITITTHLIYDSPILGKLRLESQSTTLSSPEVTEGMIIPITHDFVVRDVILEPGCSLFVRIFADNRLDGLAIREGCHFYNKVSCIIPTDGTLLNIKNIISSEITLLDLVKGVSHLFSGIFDTSIFNEVYMYQVDTNSNFDSNNVTGFYYEGTSEEEIVDLSSLQECNEITISNNKNNTNRYVQLKFKGSGDDFVRRISHDLDKNPYISKLIDLGPEFINTDVQVYENPLFEASANSLLSIGLLPFQNKYTTVELMSLGLDSGDNRFYNTNINPRIAYWYGNIERFSLNESSNTYEVILINVLGSFSTLAPTAFQAVNLPITLAGNLYAPNVAYGEVSFPNPNIYLINSNLYHYFWKKIIYSILNSFTITTTVNGLYLLDNIFRKFIKIKALGTDYLCRLLSIEKFNRCLLSGTELELIPINEFITDCTDYQPLDNCKNNKPDIVITYDSITNCYNFSMGGVVVSPLVGIQFEYAFISNLSLWIPAFSVCNPVGDFNVRMIVEYDDDCDNSVVIRQVHACSSTPRILFQYNSLLNCYEIVADDPTSNQYINSDIQYSFDNGLTWITYSGECFSPTTYLQTIQIEAVFHYNSPCPDVSLNSVHTLLSENDCSIYSNLPIYCTSNGEIIAPIIAGADIAIEYIQYSIPGSDIWLNYNEGQQLECPFVYRRVIIFCDNKCPVICTVPQLCECLPCNFEVELVFDSNNNTLSYNVLSGVCSSVQVVAYYKATIYNAITNECSGWTQISLGSPTINIADTGCYKVVVICLDNDNHECTSISQLYVQIVDCSGLSLSVTAGTGSLASKLTFGQLLYYGVPVSNYHIQWVNTSTNIVYANSGEGIYGAGLLPHPSINQPFIAGTYKPIIVASDVGNNLDCFDEITVLPFICGSIYNHSYNGPGGGVATLGQSIQINSSIVGLKILFTGYTIPDYFQVEYNGIIIYTSPLLTGITAVSNVVPITYISGVDIVNVYVFNSSPTANTIYNISIRCCTELTPCNSFQLPTINIVPNVIGCTCQFIVTGSATLLNSTCMNYNSYQLIGGSFSFGDCLLSNISIDTTCRDCDYINLTQLTSNVGFIMGFQPSCSFLYFDIKTALQSCVVPDEFVLLFIRTELCDDDGINVQLPIIPYGCTLIFNDTTLEITYIMSSNNPYTNNCIDCNGSYYSRYTNLYNLLNTSTSLFGIYYAVNRISVVKYVQNTIFTRDITEIIDTNECGIIERRYRLTVLDTNCPCTSWQLFEDTDLNGSYETLLLTSPTWTGIC